MTKNRTELIKKCLVSNTKNMELARGIYFKLCISEYMHPKYVDFYKIFAFHHFLIEKQLIAAVGNGINIVELDGVLEELYDEYIEEFTTYTESEQSFYFHRIFDIAFKLDEPDEAEKES